MENIISTATQPLLLNSVDYKLGAVASYVTARESVVTAPMTGGQFGPTNPFMRFQVADSSAISFVDTGSCRLQFDIVNTGTGPIRMLYSGASFIARARLSIRGTLCEDLMHYGRQCCVQDRLSTSISNRMDRIEARASDQSGNGSWVEEIPAGGRARISLPLKFGYFTQPLYHYGGYGALTMEFQVADQGAAIQGAPGPAASWVLSNAVFVCDVVRTTPEFAQTFAQTLLTGGRLLTPLSSMQTMMFEIPAGTDSTFSVTISRAFTRLKACFITFMGTPAVADGVTAANVYKEGNTLFCPLKKNKRLDDSNDTLEMYCQMGTQTIPTLPMKGSQSMFYYLRKTLGVCMGPGDFDVTNWESYTNNQFITAFSFEKARSAASGDMAAFSGVSSLSGEVLRIVIKGLPGTAADGRPSAMYAHLWHDSVVEHRGDGESVYV